jgi:hypothetical protein
MRFSQKQITHSKMKLHQILKQITPLPWLFHAGDDHHNWIGTAEGVVRITRLDLNTQPTDHHYLIHAANVLPELLAAAKNLQENWEQNLTEPMARLKEAIEMAEDINTTAPRAKPPRHG